MSKYDPERHGMAMKVLVGSFSTESNMFPKEEMNISNFDIHIGEEMVEAMQSADLFEAAGMELIPSISANGFPHAYIQKEAFDYIAATMLNAVRRNMRETDGIFLHLHGASHVNGLAGDSGEHYLVREIRKIVGPYLPLAIVMDPHGNVSQELADNANIIRCYRNSPHTDSRETFRKVASMLIDLLQNRRETRPAYRAVPILIGGERCVSNDEPLRSVNLMLDEIEKSEKIISASYHVGFAWADSPLCCAGVTVVPASMEHYAYAQKAAAEIADFVWSKRHDFHFTGNAMETDSALAAAFASGGSPVVITDSGDNTTAGAMGFDTYLLRKILAGARRHPDKKVLVCAINDPRSLRALVKADIGDAVSIDLGMGKDDNSAPVRIDGVISARGSVDSMSDEPKAVGDAVTIAVNNVDVVVTNSTMSFATLHQFKAAGAETGKYNIIAIKQGYHFPEMQKLASYAIMALTPGATDLMTENIPYKSIRRPMFPVDRI
jgi:microcystin degradation protein MlrC